MRMNNARENEPSSPKEQAQANLSGKRKALGRIPGG